MEILKKIKNLNKSVETSNQLVDELISILKAQKLKSQNKEHKIELLKEQIRLNIDKIDKIVENYNANN
ncbi:hypothetical protein N8X83_00135 [Alphaproteobacteria bacterium]|nr:hypothetical protein [Alphaproteobacteria bacterium]